MTVFELTITGLICVVLAAVGLVMVAGMSWLLLLVILVRMLPSMVRDVVSIVIYGRPGAW